LQPANHQRTEIHLGDPKMLLTAELCAQACTLQEQCPGVLRVRAPHQKGAQPDRWPSHYQLDGIKLAHAG
jgi:hypothetical protein